MFQNKLCLLGIARTLRQSYSIGLIKPIDLFVHDTVRACFSMIFFVFIVGLLPWYRFHVFSCLLEINCLEICLFRMFERLSFKRILK